jgi:hypothetical protein
LWWIASLIHQLPPKWWDRVTRHDRFRLLPQWHFFAPRPGRRDYHLIIRDIVEGRPGQWREIRAGEACLPTRWLWNPFRFRQKALTDLVNGLLRARRRSAGSDLGEKSERLSLPYLGLLAWVSSEPVESPSCLRQFAITSSSGHGQERDLQVVYVSDVHRVPGNGDAY